MDYLRARFGSPRVCASGAFCGGELGAIVTSLSVENDRTVAPDLSCAAGDELASGFASAGHSAVCAVPGGQGFARYGAYCGFEPDAVGADFAANADPIVKTSTVCVDDLNRLIATLEETRQHPALAWIWRS